MITKRAKEERKKQLEIDRKKINEMIEEKDFFESGFCPRCGSKDIEKIYNKKYTYSIEIFDRVYTKSNKWKYMCHECKYLTEEYTSNIDSFSIDVI